jgi:neutral amino acid transport system permease protein
MDIGGFFGTLFTDWGGQLLSALLVSYVIAAIGLNIHFGFTGLINIGQAGFMLVGAYGFALTVKYTGSFWLGLVVAILAGVLFALLLGLPTLRLRGDYLAMVTLAAAEIVRLLGDTQTLAPWTGGTIGIPNNVYSASFVALSPFPKTGTFQLGPYNYTFSNGDSWWLRVFAFGSLIIIMVISWLLVKSPWGRLLRGIREDQDAVRSLGKNVTMIKTQSLVIGGVFAAFGGVVNVLATSLSADGMGRTLTFQLYTCLLLGGAATVFGPLLGTFLYFFATVTIRDGLKFFVPSSVLSDQQIAQVIWVVVGVGLMLLVIFRPQGILGNKRELKFGV